MIPSAVLARLDEREAVPLASAAFEQWFSGSKVLDANGNPLPVYHGTGRPDRIGNRFRAARATSGPMAYFTDNGEVAGSYAQGKADTSIDPDVDTDYADWFKLKLGRSLVTVSQLWFYLDPDERQSILDLAPRVMMDDDGNPILAGPEHKDGIGNWTYTLRDKRGNALDALVECWLRSGALFNEESTFLSVLKLAGLRRPIEMRDPSSVTPFVYKVYLCIRKPLDTSAIPPAVIDAFEKASRRARPPRAGAWGADQWAKVTSVPNEWMTTLRNDLASGTANAWVTVPDWVTKVLVDLGYDGIKDTGGKHGGQNHTVWIPFRDNQVKSAMSNKKFDPAKPSIHEAISVAPIAPEPNKSIERCTTAACNAILAYYRRTPIRSAGEMPRTGRDCLNLFGTRGLTYAPVNFDPPVTVRQFAQMHQRGTWFIGTPNHAMSLVDGALFDTERKGLDGRMVQLAAQIGPKGVLRNAVAEGSTGLPRTKPKR